MDKVNNLDKASDWFRATPKKKVIFVARDGRETICGKYMDAVNAHRDYVERRDSD
tara:strand:+ start:665 stop:829 length:165 start_codon:yes stop_codon:yes gene_type:complete